MGDVEVSGSFVGKLQLSTGPLLFQTALFGMHTLLVVLSVYILTGKGLSVRRRAILLALILVIYACSTMHWAIALDSFRKLIAHPGQAPGPAPAVTITGVVAIGVNVALSDAIVLWRAHVLWGRGRIAVFVSLFLLVLTPTFLLTNVVILAKTTLSRKSLAQTAGDTVIGSLGVLSSCVTNIWATSLVVLRTVKYRREFMKFLRNYRQGRSERVLMLLAESGILYCVFWIVISALAFVGIDDARTEDKSSGPLMAQSIVFAGMAQLCGIYPTVIIVAVCLQGVTYNPNIFTGQIPGPDVENGHVSTELEFAPRCRSRTPATVRTRDRRSIITISVGLQLSELSVGPETEQESREQCQRRRQETEEKKFVRSDEVL